MRRKNGACVCVMILSYNSRRPENTAMVGTWMNCFQNSISTSEWNPDLGRAGQNGLSPILWCLLVHVQQY